MKGLAYAGVKFDKWEFPKPTPESKAAAAKLADELIESLSKEAGDAASS
jgi:hypothetical protein